MRIFIAGATGTLGLPLTERLIGLGHEVTGLTRKQEGAASLTRLGATPAIGDALDGDGLARLMKAAAPEVVIHLLTALPKFGVMKESDLEPTNHLRIAGTANVIRAAIESGARRLIAESFPTVYGVGDLGSKPLDEQAPLRPIPTGIGRNMVTALRSLEDQVLGARDRIEPIVLRYGMFYGPSVVSTRTLLDGLRARKVPLVRGAQGLGSFIHIDDAVEGTIVAMERGRPGSIYNIVDDEPFALGEFFKTAAKRIGAPSPRVLPQLILRFAAPTALAYAKLRLPLSNAKAKRELGFKPQFPDVLVGLDQTLKRLGERRSAQRAPGLLRTGHRRMESSDTNR
jgi:2-alkyl-3-oxoalkanoate reductase